MGTLTVPNPDFLLHLGGAPTHTHKLHNLKLIRGMLSTMHVREERPPGNKAAYVSARYMHIHVIKAFIGEIVQGIDRM